MVITKQDFETYLDLMTDILNVPRSQLRISAFKMFSDGNIEYFEDAKLISVLESGIIVQESEVDEDEEEEYDEDEYEPDEYIFVPWSSIDQITVIKF
ncbi:MAG: hypothetical protein ACTSO9_13005 [Candidatus Helarchaeota archaeon]